jgi:hypothetical protein
VVLTRPPTLPCTCRRIAVPLRHFVASQLRVVGSRWRLHNLRSQRGPSLSLTAQHRQSRGNHSHVRTANRASVLHWLRQSPQGRPTGSRVYARTAGTGVDHVELQQSMSQCPSRIHAQRRILSRAHAHQLRPARRSEHSTCSPVRVDTADTSNCHCSPHRRWYRYPTDSRAHARTAGSPGGC